MTRTSVFGLLLGVEYLEAKNQPASTPLSTDHPERLSNMAWSGKPLPKSR